MKILELKQNIFKENEVTADKIRDELKKQKKLTCVPGRTVI